jgi:hypothetical protein
MELVRLLLLLALAGTFVTFVGSAVLWFNDEQRSLHRGLRRVLRAPPEAMIIARGTGRGAAFNFRDGVMAVAWNKGAWNLVYKLDELVGAELKVDGQVIARVHRGEPRRALEQTLASAGQVTLRLIFDDARYPDFDLDLWRSGDEARRGGGAPADAISEANRWLARVDALLRRPTQPRVRPPNAAPAPPEPAPRPAPRPRQAPPPEPPSEQRDLLDDDDDPPF